MLGFEGEKMELENEKINCVSSRDPDSKLDTFKDLEWYCQLY